MLHRWWNSTSVTAMPCMALISDNPPELVRGGAAVPPPTGPIYILVNLPNLHSTKGATAVHFKMYTKAEASKCICSIFSPITSSDVTVKDALGIVNNNSLSVFYILIIEIKYGSKGIQILIIFHES